MAYLNDLKCISDYNGKNPIRPNPDIAGIGVMTSYWISAFLTIVLVILHYLIADTHIENSVDGKFIKLLCFMRSKLPLLKHLKPQSNHKFTKTIETGVLTLSDTQIVTGFALLVCAFAQLPSGLDLLHWLTITNLAWFSLITHFATLTVLKDYFHQHSITGKLRLGFMAANAALLAVAIFPTGWSGFSGAPVSELFTFNPTHDDSRLTRQLNPYSKEVVVYNWIFIIGTFLSRSLRLLKQPSQHIYKLLRSWPSKLTVKVYKYLGEIEMGQLKPFHRSLAGLFKAIIRAMFVLGEAVYEVESSQLFEMIWLLAGTCLNILRAISVRLISARKPCLGSEYEWGYGQIFPLFILILPLFSMWHKYQEIKRSSDVDLLPPIQPAHSAYALELLGFNPYSASWFLTLIWLLFLVIITIMAYTMFHLSGPLLYAGMVTSDLELTGFLLGSLATLASATVHLLSFNLLVLKVHHNQATLDGLSKRSKIARNCIWVSYTVFTFSGFQAANFFVWSFTTSAIQIY